MSLRPPPRLFLSRRFPSQQRACLHASACSHAASPYINRLQLLQSNAVHSDSLEKTLQDHRNVRQQMQATAMRRKRKLLPESTKAQTTEPKNRSTTPITSDSTRAWVRRVDTSPNNMDPQPIGPEYPHSHVWRPSSAVPPTDRLERISWDMQLYEQFALAGSDETRLRLEIAEQVKSLLSEQVGDLEFAVFGSLQSGLLQPSSDVDLGFYIPSLTKDEGDRGPSSYRPKALRAISRKLYAISKVLEQNPLFTVVDCIFAGRFPLVHARHSASAIDIQIVSSGRMEPINTATLVQSYCAELPQLRPLYLVLSAALKSRDLGRANTGGIGSWPLVNMIALALRLSTSITSSTDLASCLREVFDFWASMNTTLYGATVNPARLFPKVAADETPSSKEKEMMKANEVLKARRKLGEIDPQYPWKLCLQDPLNPTNDLGRAISRMQDVRQTFGALAKLMADWINEKQDVPDFMQFLVGTQARIERVARRQHAAYLGATKQQERAEPASPP